MAKQSKLITFLLSKERGSEIILPAERDDSNQSAAVAAIEASEERMTTSESKLNITDNRINARERKWETVAKRSYIINKSNNWTWSTFVAAFDANKGEVDMLRIELNIMNNKLEPHITQLEKEKSLSLDSTI